MARIAAALAAVLVASTAIAQPYRVRDIDTGPAPWAHSNPASLTRVGDVAYFTATSDFRRHLWRTNGTEPGTFLVKEGVFPEELTAAGDLLFFVGWEEGAGAELWRSDGTAVGTFMVRDIRPGPDPPFPIGPSPPTRLSAVGDILYFAANDGVHGDELWRSDGTEVGTWMVADILPGAAGALAPNGPPFAGLDGVVYFPADSGGGDIEPWRSDGSPEGTYRLMDLRPGVEPSQSSFNRFGARGGLIWFVADDACTARNSGAVMEAPRGRQDVHFVPGSSSPRSLTAFDGRVFFAAASPSFRYHLWASDGSRAGTVPIHLLDEPESYSGPERLTATEDQLFFTIGSDSEPSLWRTAGSPETTLEVARFASGTLRDLTAAEGGVYFVASNADTGAELWFSDGSAGGARLVMDIAPGPQGSDIRKPIAVGPGVYFGANDGVHGHQLWRSDGPGMGAYMVRVIERTGAGVFRPIAALDPWVFFADSGSSPGLSHLWRSDGSEEGTVRLLEDFGERGNPVPADGRLFFAASSLASGSELWLTDGTREGTRLIVDLVPGPQSSDPWSLFPALGGVFFEAATAATRRGLWHTDGTEAGTRLVCELPFGESVEEWLTTGGQPYFFVTGVSSLLGGPDAYRLW